ncbi:MAG: hypothetical protein KAI77_07000, partial [Gammaproteobacteria bacterium]|nr:hypothetical protein [Gammaproteobacteria bacterium]
AAQKRKIYEKAISEARIKDRQSAIKKADDYLLDIGLLDSDDLRIVLFHVAGDREYSSSLREALEPWPQFLDKETPLLDILKSIPNKDLASILLRIVLFQTVLRVHSRTKSFMDDITAVLPDVPS